MSAAPAIVQEVNLELRPLPRGQVGMCCLIGAEAAIFTIFVVAYLFYMGKSLSGPTPREILTVPIFSSICLLCSSLTIHRAAKSLRKSNTAGFAGWWFSTLLLGAIFLGGTIREWHHLIYEHGFTIHTNLFGTTFYSLVGLHAFHVVVGLLALSLVGVLAFLGYVNSPHVERIDVLSLYWHFVDCVWVVVFLVVYVVGR